MPTKTKRLLESRFGGEIVTLLPESSLAEPVLDASLTDNQFPLTIIPAVANDPFVLADDFHLPLEAVTETFAILAKRGSGKTYTAAVLVEEMLKAGQTVVVADPVGVWWGLRSSADGTGPGLPIAILGGDHADAPLSPEAGAAAADLAAKERLSLVLDLSHFTPPEQTRFMTLFAERLYRTNRRPLHLVLDEADQFVPQVPEAGQQPLLWAMNRIVRLGRARGLGVTLISQRPAVLAKNVLTQAEVLITLRLTSPQDRKAVEAWVSAHDDGERRREMLDSLASLPVGTAWIWSPGWLELLQKVQIRRRETFDSSATPKVGNKESNQGKQKEQGRMQPVALAAMNLDQLREKLAAVAAISIEDADPDELRRRLQTSQERVAALEKQLEKQIATPGVLNASAGQEVIQRVKVAVPVEVPVLQEGQIEQLQSAAIGLAAQADALRADADQMAEVAHQILGRLDRITEQSISIMAPQDVLSAANNFMTKNSSAMDDSTALSKSTSNTAAGGGEERGPAETPSEKMPVEKSPSEKMPLAERKILTALAQHLGGRRKNQVALLTGYAVSGGGFNNALSALRSKGWIAGRDVLTITEAGRAALGHWEPLPEPGAALQQHWARQLGKAERAILEALVQTYPRPLSKEHLGEATCYASSGGGFNNALSRLRTLGLIEGRTELRASDTLCLT